MRARFPTKIRSPANFKTLISLNNSFFNQRFKHSQTLTLEMSNQVREKRPFCRSCSKPACRCICDRMKIPPIDNPIAVTILQHNQEKNHPLNSTRIAALGLKNLSIVPVFDVHFEAQFVIRRMMEFDLKTGSFDSKSPEKLSPKTAIIERNGFVNFEQNLRSLTHMRHHQKDSEKSDFKGIAESPIEMETILEPEPKASLNCLQNHKEETGKVDLEPISASPTSNGLVLELDSKRTITGNNEKIGNFALQISRDLDFDPISASATKEAKSDNTQTTATHLQAEQNDVGDRDDDENEASLTAIETIITATIAKLGFTCSLTHLSTSQNHSHRPNFDYVATSPIGEDFISNGFIVKKLQRKQLDNSTEFEECEEFEIMIPHGSALLFPSDKSITLDAVHFEVKHLIVLDGTWGKAKRMYHENPWLKLLPHLKLDSMKMSLYSEVRHQPKAGCLSTLESIDCAMEALGGDRVRLDVLLDVFESMVGDQRRCKDERLNGLSLS